MEDKKKLSHSQKTKQNRKPHSRPVKQPHLAKDVRVNLRRAKFKSKRPTESGSGSESDSDSGPGIAPQPQRDRLSCDNISDTEEVGQDFESLVNAPISEGGHFTFKAEKDWNFDISESSQLFTLDLRLLNTAVSCIPFNECVGIEDEYFSHDQISYMRSDAEAAKQNYEVMVKDISKTKKLDESDDELHTEIEANCGKEEEQKSEKRVVDNFEIQRLEEDLDFLLKLKEPVTSGPMSIPEIASTSKEPKRNTSSAAVKSIDLEKWLDSILDV